MLGALDEENVELCERGTETGRTDLGPPIDDLGLTGQGREIRDL
jgi:hypothetical protein